MLNELTRTSNLRSRDDERKFITHLLQSLICSNTFTKTIQIVEIKFSQIVRGEINSLSIRLIVFRSIITHSFFLKNMILTTNLERKVRIEIFNCSSKIRLLRAIFLNINFTMNEIREFIHINPKSTRSNSVVIGQIH